MYWFWVWYSWWGFGFLVMLLAIVRGDKTFIAWMHWLDDKIYLSNRLVWHLSMVTWLPALCIAWLLWKLKEAVHSYWGRCDYCGDNHRVVVKH